MNLILTGVAVSNVFNGTQEVGSHGEDKVLYIATLLLDVGTCELELLSQMYNIKLLYS